VEKGDKVSRGGKQIGDCFSGLRCGVRGRKKKLGGKAKRSRRRSQNSGKDRPKLETFL